ncbi:BgTH12-01036 [Blumeria graminis f. sp. triticale]|uniref:COP9 signalosome complex subunit 4 n=3 Tax=Blumeria graminis TaxID=34373 RepID=A0A061HB31_BLUGR|nr:COP9 signalosome complex subunit [Blumeria graminis f. sp. tritici 96224]CAD6505546.1 BgTH12-01036 [Blumeria graminis f. sp. triticale]VDB93677.1 Bgt-367 [Blumeria graminis f. sp. tritici]
MSASERTLNALQALLKSTDKQQGFSALFEEICVCPLAVDAETNIANDLVAIINAIFDQNLGIVATRSLLVVLADKLKSMQANLVTIMVGEHLLNILSGQISSFEEQNAQIRELMASAFEGRDDHLAAAKVLAGIPLESSQRKVTNDDKVKIWIRITRNYLEVNDTTLAEQSLNKAKNLIYTVSDRDTNLHFNLCQARIYDAQRNFLAAAQGYHDISFMPIIAEEERVLTLSMAIKCAVLAPAGPARSRALGRLYKDERAATLEEFGILEKMFLDRLLGPDEVAKFAKGLAIHQLAKTADGSNVLARAVVEHNLRGVSYLYQNISFSSLGKILGLDDDKAEETTARMIEQKRLVGRIDQIERVIWFRCGDCIGETGNNQQIKQWDANIHDLAEEVEKVTSELQLLYPEFVARHMTI